MNAVRVAKVGGSLLDFPSLPHVLRLWLEIEPPLATVLIAGGGTLADAIREVDARCGLGEETSHWRCIEALSETAKLLAGLLPEAKLEVEGLASLIRRLSSSHVNDEETKIVDDSPTVIVFDLANFLRHEEPQFPAPLPHTWAVTSDSLAARLAQLLAAQELVLFKSASGKSYRTPAEATEAEYVDAYFPQAAARVPLVRCVNLRHPKFEEIDWPA